MNPLYKISELARLKDENPEEFNRLITENMEKKSALQRMFDSLPMEKMVSMNDHSLTDIQDTPSEP